VTKNRKDVIGIEALLESEKQENIKREKDYLQKQFESYKEFKYHFKNNDNAIRKLNKTTDE
jgi:hypothetical protein